jgi:hypothetical protein
VHRPPLLPPLLLLLLQLQVRAQAFPGPSLDLSLALMGMFLALTHIAATQQLIGRGCIERASLHTEVLLLAYFFNCAAEQLCFPSDN